MLAKAFLLLGLAGAAAFDLTMSKWNDTIIKRPFGNPQLAHTENLSDVSLYAAIMRRY